MKLIVASVMSIDGKLTKHDDPNLHSWVSDEDQVHFKSLIEETDAAVFGRKIYDLSKGDLNIKPDKLKIVLTSSPDKYEQDEVKDQLIFRNNTPQELVEYLNEIGVDSLLVAGGERMVTEFLQAGLVNEIYITIEPKIFGTGAKFVSPIDMDIELELVSSKQLNASGTLLLKYLVK